MTPTSTLTYEGTPIRLRGAMLSLTDLWRAAGRPENRRPSDWLLLEETQRFRIHAGTHATEFDDPVAANTGEAGIWEIDTDGLVAATRGNGGSSWAHWQLALSYARYISLSFHLWCSTVLRAVMERRDEHPAAGDDPLLVRLTGQFRRLHRRLDTLDRHAADLMLLQLASRDLLLGARRTFSERSQAVIASAVAASPFDGACPCCGVTPVLTEAGKPVPGAEFDHAFHRSLNRPELGWLVCADCHADLTHGGYLTRFARLSAFRRFQAAVLEQRRRSRSRPGAPTR